MKLVSVPKGLRLATALVFMIVPLAALEVAIIARAPWWKLPLRNMAYASGIGSVICVLFSMAFLSGRKWALYVMAYFAGVWVLASGVIAIRMRYPGQGFFTVLLLFYVTVLLFWLWKELSRSFFDPRLMWYQGLPKAIPGLKCTLITGDKSIDCKVCRLDSEGAFIYHAAADSGAALPVEALGRRNRSDLVFWFRDRQFRCCGVPMRSLHSRFGAGFQFQDVSSDTRKELGDFVELLWGEGYVQ
ncbi:MAG TPA: hypothetical protein VJB59_03115 [Bdellovibrionota bacterium]|nr:hypothetical protein [Bdellovibrionota bacterium]